MSEQVRLINASARSMPMIADESVQCVVTSPPYWGLRKYAGEQDEEWGGDPGHAHEWGVARTKTVSVSDIRDAVHKSERDKMMDGVAASTGTCCPCGAWYGALGLEPTPEQYVTHIVEVFREVRRVLRPDGTLWLNIGDSFAAQGVSREYGSSDGATGRGDGVGGTRSAPAGLPAKNLIGIPWRVAFALQADGWILRSDIIWAKPNPMPESVTDRPTKSHEYLFLFAKQARYYYDADAIAERAIYAGTTVKASNPATAKNGAKGTYGATAIGFTQHDTAVGDTRNARDVWTIQTQPYPGAHFATFPEALVEPCILAGSSPQACSVCGAPWQREMEKGEPELRAWSAAGAGQYDDSLGGMRRTSLDAGSTLKHIVPRTTTGWKPTCRHDDGSGICTVLDPFNGSGTTGRVAVRHGRRYIGVDISSEYLTEQAMQRIDNVQMVMGL